MQGGSRSYREKRKSFQRLGADQVPSLGLPHPKASASEQQSNRIPSVSAGPHVPMPPCWL